MKVFTTKKDLHCYVSEARAQHQKIGFVPTMGALHEGHLSLIELAREEADITICSIFVNPTQFNDPDDLVKYPRPVELDIRKLESVHCDVLFMPETGEMYGQNEKWHLDLGRIETLLEGKFRPGHYQGVTQIVKKLFDIIQPDIAFFGQKDFQQVLVIRKMVEHFGLPVKLVMAPIIRDEDGLALSSRNIHLSADEKKNALALSKTLSYARENFSTTSLPELKAEAENMLSHSPGIQLEYFEICDANSLEPALTKDTEHLVALVAAYVGKTRLIDNLILK